MSKAEYNEFCEHLEEAAILVNKLADLRERSSGQILDIGAIASKYILIDAAKWRFLFGQIDGAEIEVDHDPLRTRPRVFYSYTDADTGITYCANEDADEER